MATAVTLVTDQIALTVVRAYCFPTTVVVAHWHGTLFAASPGNMSGTVAPKAQLCVAAHDWTIRRRRCSSKTKMNDD